MLKFPLKRRGRRNALETLLPLVQGSRERLGDIPESVWLSPYLVGFLGMLITLMAQRESGPLPSELMGQLQSEAWADITHVSSELLGEEICFLSATENEVFGLGCRNAVAFLAAFSGDAFTTDMPSWGANSLPHMDISSTNCEFSADQPGLWQIFFDRYVLENHQDLLMRGTDP